jgi:hypothetical protein
MNELKEVGKCFLVGSSVIGAIIFFYAVRYGLPIVTRTFW